MKDQYGLYKLNYSQLHTLKAEIAETRSAEIPVSVVNAAISRIEFSADSSEPDLRASL